MMKIGFIVNPYAGMGGAVGLKGTDGKIDEAISRGAVKESPAKATRFLSGITRKDIHFFTAAGEMGEVELKDAGFSYTCVYHPQYPSGTGKRTTADDTLHTCRECIRNQCDIIIFCGGDGTARDVFSCTGRDTLILGIPTGVKIYSGVFATSPESAARLLSQWDKTSSTDGEVMDVDEEEYRRGHLNTNLFGYAKIPSAPIPCQSCKQISGGDTGRALEEIASFITEIMRDDTLYLLGAGTTTGAVAERLGISHTLLGIDAIFQERVVGSDLNESQILRLLDSYERVKIILSPIGAQGFILGRGNQQISHRVLARTGRDALIVIATEEKLKNTKSLYIDTGNPEMNAVFGDTIQVICGYRMAIRAPLNRETILSGSVPAG
ncbi:MAG TPA: ATP-NAD kinase family protein [Methanospirillum sp.]|uniref:ATP-NAD kinase family protein n=1 Tax=Methanospirillum sp. TaxID=45200 RepID=UPI002C40CBBF|nr:ATP-NAD kinase family protein [Methanospirillum sp.]HOJ95272.1 ATP-NAD kinase family protein [Methanospirillum sp.]HPP76649.1 ATP-NAD kinase family protein [Methanospirillum sp.]